MRILDEFSRTLPTMYSAAIDISTIYTVSILDIRYINKNSLKYGKIGVTDYLECVIFAIA
ncbi:hypothetical protein [Anabaena azotica]|uniref:Transposase n=1 Tax=Anabaena azotica FACHB-119 TaxID=947527 RepID=A0ABR8D1Y8_9NOST|nr:hypothetical protein [Anabaena azotica]MBD2501205.1 hypothetical protein [Anabaena azotica FACHB-119]